MNIYLLTFFAVLAGIGAWILLSNLCEFAFFSMEVGVDILRERRARNKKEKLMKKIILAHENHDVESLLKLMKTLDKE